MVAFDLKRFDIYRKVPKDLTQPTNTGALLSICCCLFMTVLFASEFLHFMKSEIVSEIYVDNPVFTEERIPVALNISLPRISCDVVGLDIQDEMGRHEVGFVDNTNKRPYNDGQGCIFEAKFFINRVPGNFHVSTHSSETQPDEIDFAHEITELIIGSQITNPHVPGSFNALKDKKKTDSSVYDTHEYVMKLVPTIFDKSVAYQYTYAYRSYINLHQGIGRMIPAIWFRYDLTPLTVKYIERSPPFYTFITSLCAIVGGTFTVAGIIDSIIFTASELFKKYEIGKLS